MWTASHVYSSSGNPSGPRFRRQFFPPSSSIHLYLVPRCSVNFPASVQADFHWAGLKRKAQSRKLHTFKSLWIKDSPMVFPGMHITQVQWQNWDGGAQVVPMLFDIPGWHWSWLDWCTSIVLISGLSKLKWKFRKNILGVPSCFIVFGNWKWCVNGLFCGRLHF